MTILYLRATDAIEPMPNVKQSTTTITQWISDSASSIQPKDMKVVAGSAKTSLSGTFTEPGSPHYAWTKAWISPKLQGDQTISGTLTVVLDAIESNGNKNAFPRIYVYVWKGDDTGIRGVLYNNSNSGTEEGTTEADVTYFSAITLTSVNALDGDRIVIELMEYHNNTKTASYTDTTYFDAAAANGLSRADFSQTLTFYPEYINVSDSGTGTETLAIEGQLPLTDSATGTEGLTLEAQLSPTDLGTGTDLASVSEAGVASQLTEYGDFMVGASQILDEWGNRKINGILEFGTRIILLGVEYKDYDDSGTGTDLIDLQGQIILTESGGGVEAVTMEGQLALSDAGSGVDSPSLEAQLPISEIGTGTDIPTLEGQLSLSDSGVGSENVWAGVFWDISDSGVGVDTSTMQAQLSLGDVGVGVDTPTLQAEFTMGDGGAGVEVVVIGVPISDSGEGIDVSVLEGSVPIGDIGQGLDTPQLQGQVSASDAGSGTDILSTLQAQLSILDSGVGLDVLSELQAQLSVLESGTGIEAVTVTLFSGIIKSALSMLERDMTFELRQVSMTFSSLERKMKIELMEE